MMKKQAYKFYTNSIRHARAMPLDWMSPLVVAGAPEVGTAVRRQALRHIIHDYPDVADPSGHMSAGLSLNVSDRICYLHKHTIQFMTISKPKLSKFGKN